MSVMTLPMPTYSPRDHNEAPDREGLLSLPPAIRQLLLSAGAIVVTIVLGRTLVHRFDAPVRELAVTGVLRHVRPDEVRAAAAPVLDARLFELDLDAVRLAIESLPWVAHVRVDRLWPARLAVRVTEREAFAHWGASDALSTEGIVFTPGTEVLAQGLPKLDGAPGREREVMTTYGQLVDRLSETPFALAGLKQDARGDWTATTQGGVLLRLGRGAPVEQVARLKTVVLPALASRLDSVHHIDLRYDNGFAVGWRDGSSTPAKPDNSHSPSPQAPTPAAAATPGATP